MTDLQFRLEQWGEWHRRGSIKPKQTGSFEGQYRPPPCWTDPTWDRAPDPPDPDDAWEIELAARNIALRYHLALYLYYIHCSRVKLKDRGGEMAKLFRRSKLKLRMGAADAENMVGMAQVLLHEQLQAPAVVRKERAAAWIKKQLPPIVESGIEEVFDEHTYGIAGVGYG